MDSFKDQTIEIQSDAGPNNGLKTQHYSAYYNDTDHEGAKKSKSIPDTTILENSERQTKCIQEISKSKPADKKEMEKWKNKVIGLMKSSRMNNTDKCSNCGAVKILPVLFCGVHRVDELDVICKECDTYILAFARVLHIEN